MLWASSFNGIPGIIILQVDSRVKSNDVIRNKHDACMYAGGGTFSSYC